ncbi:MAG: HlyC/CorC family transporter [Paludibacteraceae bacterium]|jgi:CBS domain containing-hemolysin-like protein|nr:HlyC/CorC family transporter [Paludibacteraceae bacterium]MED9995888.1 hemolysin family protein [Paludibacteraceae bacterium]
MSTTILWIIVTLLFSAFFSGMEIAFVTSNKLRLQMDLKKEDLTSSVLSIFYAHPDRYISTILVGNNIALVIYGMQMAVLLEPLIAVFIQHTALIALAQTCVSTLIILITGEFLPKMIFRINANGWVRFFAIPMLLFYVLLYPISIFMSWISEAIMRLFGVPIGKTDTYMLGKVDLDRLVEESIQTSDEEVESDLKFFQNALDLSKVKLRNCIVPRTEIEAVEYDASLDELKQLFVQSGYSKLLVYKENIDNIVGYVHSKELFTKPEQWQTHIIAVPIVPETMAANKLMNMLLLKNKSLAVVVDEFGGTAGIVTLEDIVEEIFGEIEDEHDTAQYVEKKISDREYIFSSRLEIDYVNETFGLSLPVSEDYLTLGGLILHVYQGFPQVGELVKTDGYTIRILKASNNKIELVKLIKDN